MKSVLIISGAYGYKPGPGKRISPKTRSDGPISLDDAEAARLVSIGVAEYCDIEEDAEVDAAGVATPDNGENDGKAGENPPDGGSGSQGQENSEAHLDVGQLMEMTRADMEKLAADMGVDVSKCKNKTEIAELLAAVPVDAGGVNDGEDPPNLTPAVPET